ncbi:hypothetical protein [Rhodocytophaga rosea]|uniref:hypothetical protein n=1 Tax=Rhodocytophaga rosea TaxID=2704465 RepID=UPI003744105D
MNPGRLTKWRQTLQDDKAVHSGKPGLTAEQLEIRCLQKELKEAQLAHDIWSRCPHRLLAKKRRSASAPRARGNLQVYKGV